LNGDQSVDGDNIKIDFKIIVSEAVDWIQPVKYRVQNRVVVNKIMKFWGSYKVEYFWT
jgi:hypothetical protein